MPEKSKTVEIEVQLITSIIFLLRSDVKLRDVVYALVDAAHALVLLSSSLEPFQ